MNSPYIDINIEGKTVEELLDEIQKARASYGPEWWPELRLLAGRLRVPYLTLRTGAVIQDVPAGSRLFGVVVGESTP